MFGAFLALLLAAPAPAQVRAVAASVAPASASAAAASASPLLYRVQLERGDAAAASRFIADTPALSWYAQNRPADLAPMLMAAHQTLDIRAAAAYSSDPVLLRRALLARSDSPLFAAPQQVMDAVGHDPSLSPAAPAFAEAMLEWDGLKENQRAALSRKGMDAARWSAASLKMRLGMMRTLYAAMWTARSQGLAPGSPEYLSLLDSYLTTAGPFFTQRGEAELAEHRERVAKLHAKLAEARARIAPFADERLSGMVEDIARAGDLGKAEAALSALFDRLAGPDRDAAPRAAAPAEGAARPALSQADFLAQVAAGLPALMLRAVKGTEAAAMLESLDAGPVKTKVVVGKSAAGSSAHYSQLQDEIVLNQTHLDAFLRWQGLTPEQFLASPGAQTRFAVLVAPVFVHEATHRRQALASDRKGIDRKTRGYLYSQSDEEESFMAQGLVARRLLKHESVREFLTEAATANKEMNELVQHWGMSQAQPKAIAAHVRKHYEGTAGEHTARSRAVSYARVDHEKLAPYRADIAAELARRNRAPAVDRAAFARLPVPQSGAPLSAYPTRALRQFARRADPTAHEGLIRFYGYLDGLKQARSALAAALTPPVKP